MARELTWHERRAINLRLQRRDGQLKRARPNPSTGVADDVASACAHEADDDTPPAGAPSQPTARDDFPQPLKGFDYAFGAVG